MPVVFDTSKTSAVIWQAKQADYSNEAMLQVFEDGRYYLIVNDDENARHIVFSREKALELMTAIEQAEVKQASLFGSEDA